MQAQIIYDASADKYRLTFNGKNVIHSRELGYLTDKITHQSDARVRDLGIKSYVVIGGPVQRDMTVEVPIADAGDASPIAHLDQFTINERFEFMRDLAKMTIDKRARALIIGGSGGIGKTHTVLQAFNEMNKVNVDDLKPSVSDLEVKVDDDEEEIYDKALAQIADRQAGDYIIVKGHSTPKALYRTLWENRHRTIVFDDCDAVLRDATAVMLLKPALDSYEDRWISWNTMAMFDDGLPQRFKFEGSMIFITNMPMDKIDEAVRTRCYKVDASMTFEQRLERMQAVLPDLMPDVPLELKQDSLDLLREVAGRCRDINFRSLMNVITIRTDPAVADWQRLARFTLLEG